ncbi:hypothetical protein F4809DRAFT_485743 [Biscogniauxia mediterranea]|nr:hypothetical protein F4809DRAFT_485743 [Biscogniauxia mediterranea]
MQRSGTLIGCILQIVGQSALTDRGVAEESDGWRHTTRLQDPTICKMNGAVQPVFCLRIPWFVFPLEGLSSPPSRCFAITLPQAAERGCLVAFQIGLRVLQLRSSVIKCVEACLSPSPKGDVRVAGTAAWTCTHGEERRGFIRQKTVPETNVAACARRMFPLGSMFERGQSRGQHLEGGKARQGRSGQVRVGRRCAAGSFS